MPREAVALPEQPVVDPLAHKLPVRQLMLGPGSLSRAMERSVRRRLPPEQRRAVIEAAAEELFAEQGFGRTTLDQIAAAAGISKQMLNRHFATKQALYLTLVERHRDGVLGRLAEGMGKGGPL